MSKIVRSKVDKDLYVEVPTDPTAVKYTWDVIGMRPIPKPSPNFANWVDKNGKQQRRVWNGKRDEMASMKRFLKETLEEQGVETFPIFKNDEPVIVEVDFYLKVPEKYLKKFEKKFGNRKLPLAVTTNKPDVDNLMKFVLDVLSGLAYTDDCQVVKKVATKFIDHDPDGLSENNGRTSVRFSKYKFDHVVLPDFDSDDDFEADTAPRWFDPPEVNWPEYPHYHMPESPSKRAKI